MRQGAKIVFADSQQNHPNIDADKIEASSLICVNVLIAAADMNDDLKAAMDRAKSLEEVAAWLDAHHVKFGRMQLSRTSADLAPELSAKLASMPAGQLFIVREGERTLLISLADIKDSPVVLAQATPQIEQFLFNKKNKDAAQAELKRLRASAKRSNT